MLNNMRQFLHANGHLIMLPCDNHGQSPITPDVFVVPCVRENQNWIYKFPKNILGIVQLGYISSVGAEKLLGACMECNVKLTNKVRHFIYAQNRSIKMMEGYKYICETCIKNFIVCNICESYYYNHDIKFGFCEACLEKSPKRLIKNYTYKVEQELNSQGNPKDGIFYGIELEYESENYGTDTVIINNFVKNFAKLKKDSSIEQGFEIVTAPCSMDVHYNIWNKFFIQLPSTVKALRTCGMHIHATRSRLTNLQIGKMLVFLHNPENREFIELIAGRKSNIQNDFEAVKRFGDGKNGGILPQNSDRHTALNVSGFDTVELRIFSTPKDKHTFFKNIEFFKALIKFTGLAEHSINESKDYRVFCQYVKRFSKEYKNLSYFLKIKLY
jgi:hypothetical protein